MSRAGARFAGEESAHPDDAPRGPSVAQRLAAAVTGTLQAIHVAGSTPASAPRHGARRRGNAPTSSTLTIAVQLTRAASSRLAWLRFPAASSRAATLRRRSFTERRLVTAFVLSLVLVASILANARPLEPLGSATGPGTAENARIAALDALAGDVAGSAPVAEERNDSVDAGIAYDPAKIDAKDQNGGGQGAPYLPDGTLLKPVAVNGSLPNLLRTDVTRYLVQPGDTLTGIAARFRVSMATLWWANSLSSKDQLKVGQELVIPPVTGILWTVKEGDTLASIASTTQGNAGAIREFNGLTSDELIIGQELMVPNGEGDPLPTEAPAAKPAAPAPRAASGGSPYSGGTLRWPVAGGYISQYFSSYHRAIDIAAPYGTSVMAAAAGTVIWAGWRNNCGGYQIWVDHGNGMSTGYFHLSAILVGAGSYVGRGEQIGRIGQSGCATGPHLHFEVWVGGPMYGGGTQVNPLLYL